MGLFGGDSTSDSTTNTTNKDQQTVNTDNRTGSNVGGNTTLNFSDVTLSRDDSIGFDDGIINSGGLLGSGGGGHGGGGGGEAPLLELNTSDHGAITGALGLARENQQQAFDFHQSAMEFVSGSRQANNDFAQNAIERTSGAFSAATQQLASAFDTGRQAPGQGERLTAMIAVAAVVIGGIWIMRAA